MKNKTIRDILEEINQTIREKSPNQTIAVFALIISVLTLLVVSLPQRPQIFYSIQGYNHINACPKTLSTDGISTTFYFSNIGEVPTAMDFVIEGENIQISDCFKCYEPTIYDNKYNESFNILPIKYAHETRIIESIRIKDTSINESSFQIHYSYYTYLLHFIPINIHVRKVNIAQCYYKQKIDKFGRKLNTYILS